VSVLGGTDDEMAAAITAAGRADVVILALGEDPDMSGEAPHARIWDFRAGSRNFWKQSSILASLSC